MDLSVIIPTFNAEKTIQSLLETLFSQKTALKYEIVLVENGSNDNTKYILKNMIINSPVPMKITCLPRGVTIAKVRNHGVKCSIGRVLAFIDSDCSAPTTWLNQGYEYLIKHSMAVLIAGGCSPPKNGTWVQKAWNSTREGHKNGSFFVHGANFFIPRELFDEVGGFREDLDTSEDYDLGCRVAIKYEVISVPEFSVIHFGDVETLFKKMKKECWYGKNSIDMLRNNLFYKPFWVSVLFISLLTGFIISISCLYFVTSLWFLLCMLFISFLMTIYFCHRSENYHYFIPLIPISFAYLLGRGLGSIEGLLKRSLESNKKII